MKTKNHRKNTMIVSAVCLILAITAFFAIISAAAHRTENRSVMVSFTQEVRLTDGTAEPAVTERELSIAQKGSYYFYVDWQVPQLDFITGCVIMDEEGQILFAITGDSVSATSFDLELKAQTYRIEMHYLANEEDYIRFVKDYIGNTVELWPFESAKSAADDVRLVEYTVEARGVFPWHVIVNGAAIISSLMLVILIWALTKKGNNMKLQFDERQELVRGRGAKYGFFTLLFCNALVYVLEVIEIPPFADISTVMVLNCLIGTCVYVVYCIWNDGYFALNADKGRLMAAFAIMGVFNLLLCAIGFASGKMIRNGRLTFQSTSLFCGIIFIVIFTVLLLKKIREDEEE